MLYEVITVRRVLEGDAPPGMLVGKRFDDRALGDVHVFSPFVSPAKGFAPQDGSYNFV